MNPEVKSMWVEALRSNDYLQGRGALNRNGLFCCLGVLCDVALKNGIDLPVDRNGDVVSYDGHSGALPLKVMDWAELEGNNPTVVSGEYGGNHFASELSLTRLNDYYMNFDEIAAVIEEQL